MPPPAPPAPPPPGLAPRLHQRAAAARRALLRLLRAPRPVKLADRAKPRAAARAAPRAAAAAAAAAAALLVLLVPRIAAPLFAGLAPRERALRVAPGVRPVFNDSRLHHFANLPIAPLRPLHQFDPSFDSSLLSLNSFATSAEKPALLLSVITVTRNPRHVFWQTAAFVRRQSLRPLQWIIINDYTDQVESYQLLKAVRNQDSRILLLNNTRDPGFPNGRMFGLDLMRKRRKTQYFAFLDDDDLFELNAYEKCVWMLESNANVSMCGSYVVGFGEKNYTWTRSFHNRISVYLNDNPLTGSEVMRTELLASTNCVFDDELSGGMEDWDFYLCVASHGKWGATIPEFLFWYRQNPDDMRQERWAALFQQRDNTTKIIRQRYRSLEHDFPPIRTSPAQVFEKIITAPPFSNPLKLSKSILLIIPWMAIGGADNANLDIVRELSSLGYRLTIVCTLLDLHGNSMESRPYFMQYTHDIFTIPAMIRLSDAPRFLSYLIESRGSQLVLVSNSQLGYGILPWLSAKHEDVRFVDYVHNEEKDWKNGGYAAFSTVHRSSLDCTFASSEQARQFMIEHGHSPSFVEVGYLGVDVDNLHPFSAEKRNALRTKLGIPTNVTVITYLARMIEHKRPRVVLEAFLNVVERERIRLGPNRAEEASKLMLLMVGAGPKLGELEGVAKDAKAKIKFVGEVGHVEAIEYMGISDIYCLPSMSEGISFAVAEAMALGVTPLVSKLGGFPELIGRNDVDGVMVDCSGEAEEDTKSFAHKMYNLLLNAELRMSIGSRASIRVREIFNSKKLVPELVRRILAVPLRRGVVKGAPQDLAPLYYTQENVLEELRVYSDFHETQRALQGKDRGAYGSRYRATCGEYSEIMTKLIDYLEEPKGCDKNKTLDVHSMRSFALGQCGQWCIMNLKDKNGTRGWQVSEGCGGIWVFDDAKHECSQWFKSQKRRR